MSLNTILATTPLTSTNYILKATGTTIGNSLIFDNGTNVGIGNTNTSYTLDVSGTGRFTGQLIANSTSFPLDVYGTTNNYGLRINNVQAATLFLYSSNANAANRNWGLFTNSEVFGDFDIRQSNAKDGDMTVGANSTSRLNINNLGNAAFTGQIKTSYVGQSMLISATTTASLRMQLINSGANAGVCIETSAGGDLFTGTSAYSMVIGTFTEKNFHIGTNSVTRLTVTSGGSVGVGITGVYSDVRFMTRGASATSADYSFRSENSSGGNILYLRNDGLFGSGTLALSPYNFDPGGRIMYVNSVGQIGSLSSTRESKININTISNIDYIYKLNPVSFNMRKRDDITYEYTDEYNEEIRYGFIADEVEKLNEDLVVYNNNDGNKKLSSVDYISFIPVLVKAIQEMNTKLDEQNQTIQNLQEQINILSK